MADEANAGAQAAEQLPAEGGAQGAAEEGQQLDLATENAILKERIKLTGEQAIREAGDLKELKAQMAELQKRSLTNQQQQQTGQQSQQATFPDKQSYIKYWTENGEKTEKEASAEYDRERYTFNEIQQLRAQQEAILAKQKFDAQERESVSALANPEIKAAVDYFKDDPIMDSLPVSEKVMRYNKYVVAQRPTVSGKDLSAIKGAAGSTVGGSGRAAASVTAEADAAAKKAGFPSANAMSDYNKVTTPDEHSAWKLKWKVK